MNGKDKLFADLNGAPVLLHSLKAFQKAESVDEIIIVSRPESRERIKALCERFGIFKLKAIADGGETRMQSVLNGLGHVSPDITLLAVHDGGRPFITPDEINSLTALAAEKGAVIPAVRVKETVKIASDGRIINTPDRSGLYLAQTPQVFQLTKYKQAVEAAGNTDVTDDAALFENAGFEVFIAEGSYGNVKITTPEDLLFYRHPRVGFGYDVHKFTKNNSAEERKLILCGADINYERGLLGHSDADVAVHALMDALLGACALGDIGFHFPCTPEYKDIASTELLARVMRLLEENNFAPVNLDITIIAEVPKLAPYIQQMRMNIAKICNLPLESVSVKATTEEGLGLAGEGIGAKAACLVKSL